VAALSESQFSVGKSFHADAAGPCAARMNMQRVHVLAVPIKRLRRGLASDRVEL
jgi:hypothetical protein